MIKLLIVDDESTTRKGLIRNIPWRELGVHQVEEAKDGLDALEIAASFHPDIVISDIRMPGIDGIELSTRMRELYPECRLIFLSGYSDKEYLKAAIHLGAINYVEKPINLSEVKEAVKNAVNVCMEDQKKKQTEKKLSNALSESIPFIKQNIVSNLINRKTSADEIINDLNLIGISLGIRDPYTVMTIRIIWEPDLSKENLKTVPQLFLDYLDECFEGIKHICVLKDSNNIIAVLSLGNMNVREYLHKIFQNVMSAVNLCPSSGAKLFCAVGQTISGMDQIPESYRTSVLALQSMFFHGYNEIVFYKSSTARSFIPDEGLFKAFTELLSEQKKEELLYLVEKLCSDIQKHEATPVGDIKNIFFRLAVILLNESDKRGFKKDKPQSASYLWETVTNFQTLQEIKEYLIGNIEATLDNIKALEANGRVVYEVMRLIQKKYADSDLSVKSLAEAVFLTPTYLSFLFKKETGKTISDYIIEYRIEKSKEFLKEAQMKLFEVAGKVGYSDANYYAKAFKKMVGMTPSEFREKYSS